MHNNKPNEHYICKEKSIQLDKIFLSHFHEPVGLIDWKNPPILPLILAGWNAEGFLEL